MRAWSAAAGICVLALLTLGAIGAPVLAPHDSDQRFPGLLNAPPTPIRLRDDAGRWRWPYVQPLIRVSQLEQKYEVDRSANVAVRFFADNRFVRSSDDQRAPILLLGSDSFGRDVLSRLLFGARLSLGLSLLAALTTLVAGALVGGVAGYSGGLPDQALMRTSEFVLVLPTMYVTLVLRSMLPLVLSAGAVFSLLLIIFTVIGIPVVARGVRGIVLAESRRDYAVAAQSLGAGHARLVWHHLLPAARGFLIAQLMLLVPAFVMAEATLSFVGLGFPDSVVSWGAMLQEASNLRTLVDFPWLLSPGLAMFALVLGLNLIAGDRSGLSGAEGAAPWR